MSEGCVTELLEDSAEVTIVFAYVLITLHVVTVLVLGTIYFKFRNSSDYIKERPSLLLIFTVFGGLIQLTWAIDSVFDRNGIPCLLIANITFLSIFLQLGPRVLLLTSVYFKTFLSRQLADFQLKSAVSLISDARLDNPDTKIMLDVDHSKRSKAALFCDKIWGFICCTCKGESRYLSHTENLRNNPMAIEEDDETRRVSLQKFPPEILFILSESKTVTKTMLFLSLVLFGVAIARQFDAYLCVSPCRDLYGPRDAIILAVLICLPLAFMLYKTRKQLDPLGIIFEIRLSVLLAIIVVPIISFLTFDDFQDLEKEGNFRWLFLWVIFSWLDIIRALGYPLYLVYREKNFKHSNRLEMMELLKHESVRKSFKAFLVTEFSVENFMFWRDVKIYTDEFEERDEEENLTMRHLLVTFYLKENAKMAVNVSAAARKKTLERHEIGVKCELDDFDLALNDVIRNLDEPFARFQRSKAFKKF